jgi:predicted peroxiredoxin
MNKKLVIKLTVSESDPEKASMAFAVAAAASASGVPVSFWLANEAVNLALADTPLEISVDHGPNIQTVLEELIANSRVWVCAPCLARRHIEPSQIREGIQVAGATAFVAELQGESIPLVY